MILLTGATGATGRRVLDRLLQRGHRVRCLVRNPARLGARRVDVQLALWNLTDTRMPGGAFRDVEAVIHLAGPLRDQPIGQLEELNATASWRLADAAAQAGVGHFVFASALGAGQAADCRFLRAKAVAERVVTDAGAVGGMPVSVVAPSLVLARGQRWASWAQALSLLPVVPVPAGSSGRSRPVAVGDVADAVLAVLEGGAPPVGRPARHEAAGPRQLAVQELVPAIHDVVGARRRRTVALPPGLLNAAVAALERPGAADREELAVLRCDTAGRRGTADLEALGIRPRGLVEALGG
ncbi:NAD(P)H-binding protein [Patulibacter sp. SYSU D01012]|uniref:NAD(P)H-binding protein n=1 Tax=Patulibacter sp. SYSU D01012 TaxID=2817381 RepID=UPI001B304C5C|nr:NAD(P)H-binding protein [Patulibacter sp. SYSU D01012]